LLGATEALMCGTTAIVDHHESPHAIEGSLDVIAEACEEVGVRVVCAYGVTDRHGPDGARRGLEESERFISGGRGRRVRGHPATTPHSRAPTHRVTPPPASPWTSASGCTCTWPKARWTPTPGRAWPRSPGRTGCSSTASPSTATCRAPSLTTPGRTRTTASAT